MTDTQVLTVAIAVVFPIVALIYSQWALKDRFGDFTKTVNQRFDGLEKHMDEKIDNAFAHMELLLRLHEAEHHKK